MKKLTNWIAVPVAMLPGSVSLAASPQYVCRLTGKVSSKYYCVQKAGKLLRYGGKHWTRTVAQSSETPTIEGR